MGPLRWPVGSLQITPLAQTSSYATGGETWLTNITEIAALNVLDLPWGQNGHLPLESGAKNQYRSQPKIWGRQNVWFRANNAILFGILPLKAQNDYIF